MTYAISSTAMKYFLEYMYSEIDSVLVREENIELLYEAAYHLLPSYKYKNFLYNTCNESFYYAHSATEIGKKNFYLNQNDLEEVLKHKIGSKVDCSELYKHEKEEK